MRWRWRRLLFYFVVVFLFFLILEEHTGGIIFIRLQNHYETDFARPITSRRKDVPLDSIAIVVIVSGEKHHSEYLLAQQTVQCYAELHKYPLYFLDITANSSLTGTCRQTDFMFQRHCILANFMQTLNNQWFLFLDGDIGVVNPNHLLEEFLPDDKHSLVVYQRIMNHEIMAGSYLARNDEYARGFLHNWSDYAFKVPNSFHGTDNGAIHSALADLVEHEDKSFRDACTHFWNISSEYYSLSFYEVCLQMYLADHPPERVKILAKGRLSWARDGWLTDSIWSPKDFMFHGWQRKRKDRIIFARWHSPLVEGEFDMRKCSNTTTAAELWRYKDTFYAEDVKVDRILADQIATVERQFVQIKKEVQSKFQP